MTPQRAVHGLPALLWLRGQVLTMGQRCVAAVTAILVAAPACAQIVPTGSPTADILLSTAITEQRTILTCTALETTAHRIAVTAWQVEVAAAVAILTENGVPPGAITAFQDAARAENLLPGEGAPFAAVKAYCNAQENWFTRWNRGEFTELGRALPGAFE